MSTLSKSLVAAGSALLLAVGCADSSTEPVSGPALAANQTQAGVQSTLYTWVEDVTGVAYQIDCGPDVPSEAVVLTGQMSYLFNVVVDGRGGVHITSNARPVGLSGVGQSSGEEYRVAEHSHESWLTTPTVRTGSYRSRLTMVGRESKQRFSVIYSGHFAVNANGELVVGKSDYQVECR
jgi:hypothetical protein